MRTPPALGTLTTGLPGVTGDAFTKTGATVPAGAPFEAFAGARGVEPDVVCPDAPELFGTAFNVPFRPDVCVGPRDGGAAGTAGGADVVLCAALGGDVVCMPVPVEVVDVAGELRSAAFATRDWEGVMTSCVTATSLLLMYTACVTPNVTSIGPIEVINTIPPRMRSSSARLTRRQSFCLCVEHISRSGGRGVAAPVVSGKSSANAALTTVLLIAAPMPHSSKLVHAAQEDHGAGQSIAADGRAQWSDAGAPLGVCVKGGEVALAGNHKHDLVSPQPLELGAPDDACAHRRIPDQDSAVELTPDDPSYESISETWLARLENGRMVKVPRQTVEALCRALHCSARERAWVLLHADRSILAADQETEPEPVSEALAYAVDRLYNEAHAVFDRLLAGRSPEMLDEVELFEMTATALDVLVARRKRHDEQRAANGSALPRETHPVRDSRITLVPRVAQTGAR